MKQRTAACRLNLASQAGLVLLMMLPLSACQAESKNASSSSTASVSRDEQKITVHPAALSGPITNPGIGVETFHNNWEVPLPLELYPESGVDYFRFYWTDLEPEEGEYAFGMVDRLLAQNRAALPSQMVALRFMTADGPESGSKIPDWLIKKGIRGNWTSDGKTFVPDLDDSLYLHYVEKLLNAFGQRYDGNTNLSHIDIGMVGSWGEWHNSNFTELEPLHQRYSDNDLNKLIDMHFAAFPNTPKVMLISGENSLAYAVEKGAGWRADCWGDWHNFSDTWSHMVDDYPYRLAMAQQTYAKFNQAWQTAPISLETCGNMSEWWSKYNYTREQVKASLDWAIAQHASTLNLKSHVVPTQYRDLLDDALAQIGYRLRVDTLVHPAELTSGATMTVQALLVNEGNAPPYQHHYLAYRLVNEDEETAFFNVSTADVMRWLPGEHATSSSFTLPETIPTGHYYLELALVDRHAEAEVNLANEGLQASGWYRLSDVTIR